MSTIESSVNSVGGSYPKGGVSSRGGARTDSGDGRHGSSIFDIQDTVEISDAARARNVVEFGPSEELGELASSMRSKFEFLSKSKKDLNSHIEAVLKRSGIKLGTNENIRVETTAGGKIRVAGVDDKEKRKRIEDALNKENGLSDKIQEHNVQYRDLSGQVKAIAGITLDTLIHNLKNEVGPWATDNVLPSPRHKQGLEMYPVFDHYPDLQESVMEMCETERITYNSISKPVAEPENTLKGLIVDSHTKLAMDFAEINRKILEEASANGETIDEEFKRNFLYHLNGVSISVGSDGAIEIEGTLAGDPETDETGKEIIKAEMERMMERTDDTGELCLFEEATARLLEDYELAFGNEAADDASVRTEIGRGLSPGGSVRLSSPSKEAELDDAINVEVNVLLADLLELDEVPSFEVSVDKDGRLSIENLPEDEVERTKVLHALEVLNANVDTEDEGDVRYGALTRLVRHRRIFLPEGIDAIYAGSKKSGDATITSYSIHEGEGVTMVAEPKYS